MENNMKKLMDSRLLTVIFVAVLVFSAASFLYDIKTVEAAATCSESQANNDHRFTYDTRSDGTALVINTADCDMPMTLMVYKMYSQSISTQTIYDYQSMVVPANSTRTLRASVPSCMAQIDLFYGLGSRPATAQEVDYAIHSGSYCTNTNPPITPPVVPPSNRTLTGSCAISPSSANIGEYLSWSATASGGTGSYTYSWTGTDNLYGNSSYVSKPYFSSGTKTGTVTITSGSQSITRSCSATINQVQDQTLSGSCSVNPSSINVGEYLNWSATASGGNGSYSYSWTGTDNLYGNSSYVSKPYFSSGTKTGTVTITSGSQSITRSCNSSVDQNIIQSNLRVSCYASNYNLKVGEQMNWYANVTGGDGDYDYDWNGTDGLNSSSRTPHMTYYNLGNKTANVTVESGDGQTVSTNCYANVQGQNVVLAYSQAYQPPMESAVYLSQVPYTGLADNFKLVFFLGMIALFSAWIAYIITSYQKNNNIEMN